MTMYSSKNVFEEALDRIRFVYDNCDDVIVSMSGGKDSTVLFHLTLIVAKERGKLPLKVFWLDQEAEWQNTVEYMSKIMRMPEVAPYWFQIPFDFTNSLSHQNNFLRVWDEEKEDEWIHPKSDISIKENPSKYRRFHDLVTRLPGYCTEGEHCAVLVGMRISESLNRRVAILNKPSQYKGITWCRKPTGRTRVFWPIYDFQHEDIWAAIAKNRWDYNRIYDMLYKNGVAKKDMRVSALIHETSWHAIEFLQEFEPHVYNRFTDRVHGVGTFSHMENEIMVRTLPFAFKDWREYRDYLLVNLVKPEYHELFMRRWANQNEEEWYRVHVSEILVNDIDGTLNANARSRINMNRLKGKNNKYYNRDKAQFDEYMRGKQND